MKRLCFLADKTELAQTAAERLKALYGQSCVSKADALVVLGGDGFLLQTMHKHIGKNIPFYGMN